VHPVPGFFIVSAVTVVVDVGVFFVEVSVYFLVGHSWRLVVGEHAIPQRHEAQRDALEDAHQRIIRGIDAVDVGSELTDAVLRANVQLGWKPLETIRLLVGRHEAIIVAVVPPLVVVVVIVVVAVVAVVVAVVVVVVVVVAVVEGNELCRFPRDGPPYGLILVTSSYR